MFEFSGSARRRVLFDLEYFCKNKLNLKRYSIDVKNVITLTKMSWTIADPICSVLRCRRSNVGHFVLFPPLEIRTASLLACYWLCRPNLAIQSHRLMENFQEEATQPRKLSLDRMF